MSGYDVCKHGRIRCAECAYVEELEDRNKRYREALEFYANKENWKKLIIDNNTMYLGEMNVEQDYGEKARKALEGEK